MIKKIAGISFGLVLIIAPAFALAESGDVQVKIAALLAQIKQLQALILQMQNQTSVQSNCVDLTSNLTLGSSGGDVTSLQNYLINSGLLDSQYNTGYYGFITAKAVGKLQMNFDIVSSQNDTAFGIMGPKTRAAIACSETSPSPMPPSPSLSADLKINGSDGPIYLADNDQMTLSWTSTGASGCYLTNVRQTPGGTNASVENLGSSGTMTGYAAIFKGIGNVAVQCGQAGDQVNIKLKEAATPSASIDQNTLTGSTGSKDAAQVTLSGSASNVSIVSIALDNADGGSGRANVNVSNGRWSVTFGSVFPGTHTVTVMDADTGQYYSRVLITGRLSVSGSPAAATATIDQSSLSSTSDHPRITGRASGTSVVGLSISKGGDKFDGTGSFATDQYGNWGITLSNQIYASGTYTVYVYDGSNNLLTSGTLTVSGSSATASLSVTSVSPPQVIVAYTNLPVHSYINLLWKNENGQTEAVGQGQTSAGGSGTITIQQDQNAPSGYYIAEARTTDSMSWTLDSAQFVYKSTIAALNCTVTASPSTVVAGTNVVLTWNSLGANNIYWNQNPAAKILGLSATNIAPSGSQTFLVNAGAGTVTPVLMLSRNDGFAGNCSTSITVTGSSACTITASAPYDSAGHQVPVTLSWTSSSATNGTLTPYIPASNTSGSAMSVATNGSMTVNPTDTTNYTLHVDGTNGGGSCMVQVGLKG
jgi:hypothetical protein